MVDVNKLGLLQMGVSQVVRPATGDVIGWVHASPDEGGTHSSDEGGQYQRWLLFEKTDNDFEVRPAPPDMASLSLPAWRDKVRSLWPDGKRYRYIWARARIYVHGGSYGGVTWTSLPPAERLPPAQSPGVRGIDFQLDVTGGKVIDVAQQASCGLAAVFQGQKASSTIEYWCLGADYQPAGRAASVRMSQGSRTAPTTADFLALAAPGWGPGSSLVIVGCVTYEGDVASEWL